MPKVSVIIPTYNRPKYLPRAIQSVRNQTYQDFEIIVVDDGTSIRAEKQVRSIKDERIRYIAHSQSRGGAAARNTGIRAARGTYVAFLDDDDEWLPAKLALQVKVLDQVDNSVSLVFTGLDIYDKNNKLINTRLPGVNGVIYPLKRTLNRCFIWTSSILIRKYYTDRGFIFDEQLKKNQEWDLQLRLLEVSTFYSINRALFNLHILGDDEHMGGKKNIKNIINGWEVFLKKHRSRYYGYAQAYALQLFKLALLYRDSGQFAKARKYMLRAWWYKPNSFLYARHAILMLCGEAVYLFISTKNKSV